MRRPTLLLAALVSLLFLSTACDGEADAGNALSADDAAADVVADSHDATPDADEPDTAGPDEPDTADPDTPVDLPFEPCDADDADQVRPDGWGRASHCKGEDADYARLFDADVVHRLDIVVSPEMYQASMDDLDELLGGSGGGFPGGPGGGSLDGGDNPVWVPVEVRYDGLTWWNVGMRYKGNSSLRSSYNQGVKKLSFRLDFDEFEADFPEIDDQRFFGFKKMTFSNGFKDASLIRDRLAADIFRDAGVPAARGSFAAVWVDYGDGPVYFGLYTMIEDPSDELLETQFDDDSGNLYKPEGDAATWADGTWDPTHFDKKTNEDAADWSDILAAWDALHSDESDAAAWRAGLEAVLDVDGFLMWLAVNQAIQHWDTYGTMNHNYYVYADPSAGGRLVWFPWDLNEALVSKSGGPGGSGAANSVMCDVVGDGWPMIRFLLDDPTYRAQYKTNLQAVLDGPFAEAEVGERAQAYHDLIAPYIVGPEAVEASPYTLTTAANFEASLSSGSSALLPHISSRHSAVSSALAAD